MLSPFSFPTREQPKMVFNFPFGPPNQPENSPFGPPNQSELVTKSDFQRHLFEINDGTDDSETLDRSTPESTEAFQMNSVDAVGIPPSWNEDKVKEAFKDFGHIEQVLASKNKKITTIKYATQEGALSCIASFSKKKLTNNGRKVNVHVSLAKPEQKDKRIEERSRPHKKNKLNEKADECSSRGLEMDSIKEGERGTTLVAVATDVCILMGSETRGTDGDSNMRADIRDKYRPLGDYMACSVGGNLQQAIAVHGFMLTLVNQRGDITLRDLRTAAMTMIQDYLAIPNQQKLAFVILVGDRREAPSEAIWLLNMVENTVDKDEITHMASGGTRGEVAQIYLEDHFSPSQDRFLMLKNVVRAIHVAAFEDEASGGTSQVYTANSTMPWKRSNVCAIAELPG